MLIPVELFFPAFFFNDSFTKSYSYNFSCFRLFLNVSFKLSTYHLLSCTTSFFVFFCYLSSVSAHSFLPFFFIFFVIIFLLFFFFHVFFVLLSGFSIDPGAIWALPMSTWDTSHGRKTQPCVSFSSPSRFVSGCSSFIFIWLSSWCPNGTEAPNQPRHTNP